jgi:hypothetical protein
MEKIKSKRFSNYDETLEKEIYDFWNKKFSRKLNIPIHCVNTTAAYRGFTIWIEYNENNFISIYSLSSGAPYASGTYKFKNMNDYVGIIGFNHLAVSPYPIVRNVTNMIKVLQSMFIDLKFEDKLKDEMYCSIL